MSIDLSKCSACQHAKHIGCMCCAEVSTRTNGEGLVEPVRCACDDKHARKADAGKLMFRLIPPLALRDLAEVYTYGAKKYAPDSWRTVEDAAQRYEDAMWRHLNAWKAGETVDAESGLPHLSHALWNVVALMELARE